VLRALFEFEQALYGDAIVRVAAQPVAGFGGVSDQAAAPQMRGNAAIRCAVAKQLLPVGNGAPADIAPHLAAIEVDSVGDFIGAFLRHLYHGTQRGDAQHAPAVGHHLAVLYGRAGVEHMRIFQLS